MKPPFRKSLQGKIFIFTLLIVFIPLVGLGSFFYYQSNELIIEKLRNADENMIEQIGSNLEFVMEDVHDLSLFFIQSEQGYELLTSEFNTREESYEVRRNVEELFLHLIGSKDYIHSIQIGKNNEILAQTGKRSNKLSERTKEELDNRNGSSLLTANKEESVLAYSRLVKNVNDVTEGLAYITINIRFDYLEKVFLNKITNELDSYFLINEDSNTVLLRDTIGFNKRELEELLEPSRSEGDRNYTEKLSINSDDFLKTFYEVEGTPLSIVHVVSLQELRQGNQVIPGLIIFAFLVSLFICILVAYQFSKYIVRPIERLQALMKHVEDGRFDVRFTTAGQNEMDLLGKGFNSMIERIKFLIDMVYLSEIKGREAELKALYAQINPHFLYNTLDTIYWMGQMENAPKSAEMTRALSKLFRMMLKTQKETWNIQQEILYAENYINIQKVRYEDVIQFEIDTEEKALMGKTIRMVLQPLIENAIVHGIEPVGEGRIYVSIKKNESELRIVVEDTGVGSDLQGMEDWLSKEPVDQQGIALRNIHERIQIHSGEEYGLSFYINDSGGLSVVVRQKWEVEET